MTHFLRRFLVVLALLLAGPAMAQDPAAVAQAAPYLAIESCMKDGKDSQAQTTCVLSIALLQARSQGGAAATQSPVVVQTQDHWAVGMVKTVFGGLYGAVRDLGPTAAAVYQARASKDLGIRQAEYSRDTSIATTRGFVDLGTAGVNGTRDVGIAGFQTIGARPQTAINVTAGGDSIVGGGIIDRRNCATFGNPSGAPIIVRGVPSITPDTVVPGTPGGPVSGGC